MRARRRLMQLAGILPSRAERQAWRDKLRDKRILARLAELRRLQDLAAEAERARRLSPKLPVSTA